MTGQGDGGGVPLEGDADRIIGTGRHRPGTSEGVVTSTPNLFGHVKRRDGKPGVATVLQVSGATLVVFEFRAGDVLPEHAARHPVLLQMIRGCITVDLPDRCERLGPGRILHLTPMLRHTVVAVEPSTLLITMLTPRE